MELRQLRYFVTLAEESHFGRAAAREHIVQSALSQQLQRLERELGVLLIERTTHHVRLSGRRRKSVASWLALREHRVSAGGTDQASAPASKMPAAKSSASTGVPVNQNLIFVLSGAGAVQGNSPVGGRAAVAQPQQRNDLAVGEAGVDVGEPSAVADVKVKVRPAVARVLAQAVLQRSFGGFRRDRHAGHAARTACQIEPRSVSREVSAPAVDREKGRCRCPVRPPAESP